MSRYQSLFHGSKTRFRPEEIEPGDDGLIHLHLNPNPVRISYRNIYHFSLSTPLANLPFVVDQGQWEVDGLMWDLSNISKALSNDDCSLIERLGGGCETRTREALYDTLRDKGLVGVRYVNAYEFPGTSVAILDSSALTPECFDKFYGESFEDDYEEAMEGISEDELTVSMYCTSAVNHGTIGHWPGYLAELDDLISRIKKSFIEDDYGDPASEDEIARAITECNNIRQDTVHEGMAAVAGWKRRHPEGWTHEDCPFSLTPLTTQPSEAVYEIAA